VSNDSKFQRLSSPDTQKSTVLFTWEGQQLEAQEGDSIAIALLTAGVKSTRDTPQSNAPRAPFCMMGSCFECRVIVNGEHNVQSCMRLIEDGMQIQRQKT